MQTGRAGDQTTNHLISGQLALPQRVDNELLGIHLQMLQLVAQHKSPHLTSFSELCEVSLWTL